MGGLALQAALSTAPTEVEAETVVYRVNCGGPQVSALDAGPAWGQDLTGAGTSPYVNGVATGDNIFGSSAPIGPPHSSVPSYVPAAIFADERWDPPSNPEMTWEFPVGPGTYRVNLFVAEAYSGTQAVGARTVNVVAESVTRLAAYDIYALYGGYTPGMETFLVSVADGGLTLGFEHIADDPAIRGIEIVAVSAAGNLAPSESGVDFGSQLAGTTSPPHAMSVTNLGAPGDPAIHVTDVALSGPFTTTLTAGTVLPGQSRTFQVRFAPVAAGSASGSLVVTHDGVNSPVTIALSGTGTASVPIGFGKSTLAGASSYNPTSLAFGPDGRLYVAQKDGYLKAYTLSRAGANDYAVTATETIDLIRSIPNHGDDGTLQGYVVDRLVTGLCTAGTAANPVLFVSSSDPRMNVAGDIGLDTNSGTISRLTWNGSAWVKLDLVRGLPRSENDHCTNGLALDAATNTLYVAQGGNANMGAPSLNFSFLPEYALSAAILSVDLGAIGETTYDLPTLDDEDRPGASDANDPFGGNDGRNQARLVPGGPVQVHSPGWRNPYDVCLTSAGRLYAIDNGPNAGWGGPPIGEGPGASCTNSDNDANSASLDDNLHFIPAAGFYAGHPNPTRATTANTFNASNPQSPVPSGNSVECDYKEPGTDGSLARWPYSTNGLAEYRAGNFGGAMQGDLLAVSFANTVERVKLSSDGASATLTQTLFSNVGYVPLDVTTRGDAESFHGTIWVADYVGNSIVVFEPSDYDGGGAPCTAADEAGLDEDGDGYSNADELDNGTSPCSAGDVPPDFDTDFLSDRTDTDDDNDGVLDPADAFARDAANGGTTTLPVLYSWDGGDPGFGLFGLGFTGLMTNGTADYLSLYDGVNLTPGGAAGKLTIDAVPAGDARGALNSQAYGFQFGVATDSTSGPFTVATRVSPPLFGGAPAASQSFGVFLGTGTQSDYVSLVLAAEAGSIVARRVHESGDVPSDADAALPGPTGTGVDLTIEVDPATGTLQPYVRCDGFPRVAVGAPVVLAHGSPLRAVLRGPGAIAAGILSTSRGAAPFTATWDYLNVTPTSPVGVADAAPATGTPRLHAIAPNPVRRGGHLAFHLPSSTPVRLALYDVNGARVRSLTDGWRPAGAHRLHWDGHDGHGRRVKPGVYFARLDAGPHRLAQRIVVLE